MKTNKVELCNTISETLSIGVRTVVKVLFEYENAGTVTSPKRMKGCQSSTIFGELCDFTTYAVTVKVHSSF